MLSREPRGLTLLDDSISTIASPLAQASENPALYALPQIPRARSALSICNFLLFSATAATVCLARTNPISSMLTSMLFSAARDAAQSAATTSAVSSFFSR